MPETVDESKDVEYQIWWNEHDKYPYVHQTSEGARETVREIIGILRERYGIRLSAKDISIRSRVVLTQVSEWVDETLN